MYEVEIKVPADLDAVRRRLRELGAERQDTRRQRDVYYDAPHRNFARTDEALRLRHETTTDSVTTDSVTTDSVTAMTAETTRITYKGPLLEEASKTREEHETSVADSETMAAVLTGLGFAPAATVTKQRERWSIGDVVVTLDEVTGVGEFVEVERDVPEEAKIDEARRDTMAVVRQLGLDPDDQIRTSYLGLLLDSDEDTDASIERTDSSSDDADGTTTDD